LEWKVYMGEEIKFIYRGGRSTTTPRRRLDQNPNGPNLGGGGTFGLDISIHNFCVCVSILLCFALPFLLHLWKLAHIWPVSDYVFSSHEVM
jgi:hypothetical protein